jgi:hypothetical protein
MPAEQDLKVLLESAALAGLATRILLHPLDTLKVRLQVDPKLSDSKV